jgi:hypothetical protein
MTSFETILADYTLQAMTAKARINVLCMTLGAALGLLSGYLLYNGQFVLSLVAIMGTVACMETRVRMGYRSPRRTIFAAHLALSIAYLIALAHLSFGMHEPWVTPLAWFSYAGMALSGAILIRRSWHLPT